MASSDYVAGYTAAYMNPGKKVNGVSKNFIAGYTAFLKSNNPIVRHSVPPPLRLPSYIPNASVGRYNVLNNQGKTVNIFRQYASSPDTRIRWVVGHGSLTGGFPKVPANTFIVFIAEPGHSYNQSLLLPSNRAFKSESYLRNVFSGKEKNVRPVRLKYWKEHVYGPNDEFPDLKLSLYDFTIITNPYNGTNVKKNVQGPLNSITGVTNVKNGRRTLHKQVMSLSELVKSVGPGIYLVNACRTVPLRVGATTNNATKAFNTYNTAGRYMPPVKNSGISRVAQKVEQNQARTVTRKRSASTPPKRTYANVVAGRGKNRPLKRARNN